MERRYQVHLQELLDDAVVAPEQCQGMLARLEQFVEPFAACLVRSKQRTLARQYVAGLASQLNRKNVESIAYHHDQDRQMLQKFIGQYTWDHRPLVGELVRQVGAALGRADAVLVIDPSAFAKKGTEVKKGDNLFEFPQHGQHPALHLHTRPIEDDWLHRRIGGLQPDTPIRLMIKALEGGFAA